MPRHLPTSQPRAQLGRRSLVRTGVTAASGVGYSFSVAV